eukprot:tig00020904_g15289.t1
MSTASNVVRARGTAAERAVRQPLSVHMEVDGGDHVPIPHMRLDHVRERDEDELLDLEREDREPPGQLLKTELRGVVLLVLLYCLQGVPMGLVFGSLPFLLQQKASFSQIGFFSFATYPYSVKLLWSPLVDSLYFKSLGRRKSWIIPAQCVAGLFMVTLSYKIDEFVSEAHHIPTLTAYCIALITLIATQDIAVDGWALTLLSRRNVAYASTCQTTGLNIGYFLSFTIFLALNSPDFANRFLRSSPSPQGALQLSEYLRFWGWMYLVFSAALLFFREAAPGRAARSGAARAHRSPSPEGEEDSGRGGPGKEMDAPLLAQHAEAEEAVPPVGVVYKQMLSIVRLPNMRTLIGLLLTCKLAFAAADAATALKLLDRGFRREDMALLVLVEFPFEIIFAVMAGRWSSGSDPLRPWLNGYRARLLLCPLGALLVYAMPRPVAPGAGLPLSFYAIVMAYSLIVSLASTAMFVSMCAYFSRISDTAVGGTYMTLLNTLSNLGGTWPKAIVLFLIDYFTTASCRKGSEAVLLPAGQVCTSGDGKDACSKAGGSCDVGRDGYFVMIVVCLVLGTAILRWLTRTVKYLHTVRESDWKLRRAGAA